MQIKRVKITDGVLMLNNNVDTALYTMNELGYPYMVMLAPNDDTLDEDQIYSARSVYVGTAPLGQTDADMVTSAVELFARTTAGHGYKVTALLAFVFTVIDDGTTPAKVHVKARGVFDKCTAEVESQH